MTSPIMGMNMIDFHLREFMVERGGGALLVVCLTILVICAYCSFFFFTKYNFSLIDEN